MIGHTAHEQYDHDNRLLTLLASHPSCHHDDKTSGKAHEFVAEGMLRVIRVSEGGKHIVFITFDSAAAGADDEVSVARPSHDVTASPCRDLLCTHVIDVLTWLLRVVLPSFCLTAR